MDETGVEGNDREGEGWEIRMKMLFFRPFWGKGDCYFCKLFWNCKQESFKARRANKVLFYYNRIEEEFEKSRLRLDFPTSDILLWHLLTV
jgi:hypothetical protein